jgi:aminoglycoside 6'-N-acetyltransferase I
MQFRLRAASTLGGFCKPSAIRRILKFLIRIESMAHVNVRPMRQSDRDELGNMYLLLWPDASAAELRSELDDAMNHRSSGTLPIEILVSVADDGALTGFLEVGLRSHADGCDPARPVAFVEAWFVHEKFRNRGVGRALLRASEDWARAQGCVEMASDALIENEVSLGAHQAAGFDVVDRCVHFRKKL